MSLYQGSICYEVTVAEVLVEVPVIISTKESPRLY